MRNDSLSRISLRMRAAISRRLGSSFSVRPRTRPRRAHGKRGDLADVEPVDLDRQRLRPQPRAVADAAGRRGHVAADFLARPFAFGFAIAPLEIADDAFERLVHFIASASRPHRRTHALLARAVENHRPEFLAAASSNGMSRRNLKCLRERFERLHVIGRSRLRPGRDGALAQRQFRDRAR